MLLSQASLNYISISLFYESSLQNIRFLAIIFLKYKLRIVTGEEVILFSELYYNRL